MQVYPDQEHLDIEGQFHNQSRNINMNTSSNHPVILNPDNNQGDNPKSLLAEHCVINLNTFNEFVKKLQKSTEEFNKDVYSSYGCFLFHLFAKQDPVKLASENYRKQLDIFFTVLRDFIARENLVKRYNAATTDVIGIIEHNKMLFESLRTNKFDGSKLDEKASKAQFNEFRATCRDEALPTLHLLLLNLIKHGKLKPLQLKYVMEEKQSFGVQYLYNIKRQALQEAGLMEQQRLGKPSCKKEMSLQEVIDELKRDESYKEKHSLNVRHKTEQSLQSAINHFKNRNLNLLEGNTESRLNTVRWRNFFATINLLSAVGTIVLLADFSSDKIDIFEKNTAGEYSGILYGSFFVSWAIISTFFNHTEGIFCINNSKELDFFTFTNIQERTTSVTANQKDPFCEFIAETYYMEKVVKDFEQSEQSPLIRLAALNVCDGAKKYDQFQGAEKERIQQKDAISLSNAFYDPDKASSQKIKNTTFYKSAETSLELYNKVLKKIRMHPGGAEDYVKSM